MNGVKYNAYMNLIGEIILIYSKNHNKKELGQYYLVVFGSSLAGISIAKEFDKNGKNVMLFESRTYLGYEMGATLRPWLTIQEKTNIPQVVKAILQANGIKLSDEKERYPVQLDKVKVVLEDEIIESGVKLLYATYPVDIEMENDKSKKVIVGNKAGKQIIYTNKIIDATSSNIINDLIGKKNCKNNSNSTSIYSRTIEFSKVQHLSKNEYSLPEELGLVDDKIHIIPGYKGEGHYFVQCYLKLSNEEHAQAAMKREIEARHKTME